MCVGGAYKPVAGPVSLVPLLSEIPKLSAKISCYIFIDMVLFADKIAQKAQKGGLVNKMVRARSEGEGSGVDCPLGLYRKWRHKDEPFSDFFFGQQFFYFAVSKNVGLAT